RRGVAARPGIVTRRRVAVGLVTGAGVRNGLPGLPGRQITAGAAVLLRPAVPRGAVATGFGAIAAGLGAIAVGFGAVPAGRIAGTGAGRGLGRLVVAGGGLGRLVVAGWGLGRLVVVEPVVAGLARAVPGARSGGSR